MFYTKSRIRNFFIDLLEIFISFFKRIGSILYNFTSDIFITIRFIIYSILSFISIFTNIAFIASFYYGYKCVNGIINGVPFKMIKEFDTFGYLFLIPIVVYIAKEFIKPNEV